MKTIYRTREVALECRHLNQGARLAGPILILRCKCEEVAEEIKNKFLESVKGDTRKCALIEKEFEELSMVVADIAICQMCPHWKEEA